ncbi:prephenate dehydrogenase [Paraburkholderia solisilvae]|uniref:Cyclohexadienyl dehydrogenase n=1 Tax=Paraburkholderia solisilvae TaxID=624376 RepID=A0A6J5EDK3_9BURK|nr:prephenate dehydrogenase/arogenate dehydrogenase family protein [Paraburkholderia solisilvae]CAB3763917.1 Cyclohexadienyl dehydrogenase [Paraburkholderia solisilvae]
MAAFSFDKLVIFGVGLIGGSLARALRERGDVGGAREVVGVGRTAASTARALELNVIDRSAALDDDRSLAEALDGADIVLLAAPVAQTRPLLERIAPFLGGQTIITDAGSTKADVVAAARAVLGPASLQPPVDGARARRAHERLGQFVPGHPIAGREASGVEAALADLYVDRNVVLCPLPESRPATVARVADMWRAAGATVHEMAPPQHDRVLASVSHLPHVLAFAYIEQILQSQDAALRFAFASGGFRDFTRIAASSPEMWRDICIANRTALLEELDGYTAVLAALRAAIEAGDGAALEAVFARSRAARTDWQLRAARPAAAANGDSESSK